MDDSLFHAWFGMSRVSLVESLRRLADDLEKVGHGLDADRPAASLDTWALAQRSVPCLIGRVIGHPTIADGNTARTSELFYFDPEHGLYGVLVNSTLWPSQNAVNLNLWCKPEVWDAIRNFIA